MSKDEALKLALDALDEFCELGAIIRPLEVRDALKKALAEQPAYRAVKTFHEGKPVYVAEQPAQQEPVALKWQQAPVRTAWGDDMVVASVAIDKDHTVCLYCERDQTSKVDAMFAQRTWVGLTDEQKEILNFLLGASDIDDAWFGDKHPTENGQFWWRNRLRKAFQDAAIAAKLKEKNT